jgi:hypothetical protein
MPWKECHVMDERLRFVAPLLDGEKMAIVCLCTRTARYTCSAWPRMRHAAGVLGPACGS